MQLIAQLTQKNEKPRKTNGVPRIPTKFVSKNAGIALPTVRKSVSKSASIEKPIVRKSASKSDNLVLIP